MNIKKMFCFGDYAKLTALRDENRLIHTQYEELVKNYTKICDINTDLDRKLLEFTNHNADLLKNINILKSENNSLKEAVVILERTNVKLEATNIKLDKDVSNLEATNSKLTAQISTLELTNTKLTNQITNLESTNTKLNTELKNLEEMIKLFGNNITDIKEKLFQTYYEYKNENKIHHLNNLLDLYLKCDVDNDTRLNRSEYTTFQEHIRTIYNQTINNFDNVEFITFDMISKLNISFK